MAENSWENFVIKDLEKLRQKKVLIRVDFNLPTKDGVVLDTYRLDSVVSFLKDLYLVGAKIILLSHFGEKGESIKPVADIFIKKLPFTKFLQTTNFEEIKKAVDEMNAGETILLENTRMFKGEEENVPSLARNFAELGDVFINDAFSVSHREHASIVGIPKSRLSYFGPTFERELTNLSNLLNPKTPALLILGGAKFGTKLNLIRKYVNQGVDLYVGGALAHAFMKGRGKNIGKSFYDDKVALTDDLIFHANIDIPNDVTTKSGDNLKLEEMTDNDIIVDIGKESILELDKLIDKSETIIMNGPLGLYEDGFRFGTEKILTKLSLLPKEKSVTIGGGDTVACANTLGVIKDIGYVSLGGGAMLEYLANGTLPGITAISSSGLKI